MRVYQFRHIRAAAILAAATLAGMLTATAAPIGVTPTMIRALCPLCAARALLPRGSAAAAPGGGRGAGPAERVDRDAWLRRRSPADRCCSRARAQSTASRRGSPRAPRPASRQPASAGATARHQRRRRRRPASALVAALRRCPASRTVDAGTSTRRRRRRLPDSRRPRRAWQPGLRNRATGSRSGSSTTASTRRIRSSPPPASRCLRAFRRASGVYDGQGHRRPLVRARRQTWRTRAALRSRRVGARHARRRDRRRRRRHDGDRRREVSGVAPARVHRQLPRAHRSHRRGRRSRRQRPRDRRGDRGSRRGRHGRDQPLDRRARDRAVPRHRRARTRRGGRGRRRPGRRRRQRLRRFRRGSITSPGTLRAGDHRRRRHDPERRRRTSSPTSPRPARHRSRSA